MKFLIIFLFIYLVFTPSAISYPQDQLDECINSAKLNPAVEGATESSIEGFCDCALKAIIDKGKEEKTSAKKCARKNFKNS